MRAMYLAFAALAVITVAAPYALNSFGFSAADRTASDSVRLN